MTEQAGVSSKRNREALLAAFGGQIEFDKPLAALTTYQTGGPARYFLETDTRDLLCRAVSLAQEYQIPFFVMGGGSNLLVSDSGYDGLVIKVTIKGIKIVESTCVRCGAGEDLAALVDFAAASGLAGLEFSAGIYGTVGGAIYGNAGAFGGEIKDILKEVVLVDRAGNVKTVGTDYCGFGYRDSVFKQTGEIIVEALFKLEQGERKAIESKINEILAARKDRHPTQGKSAGCFFKNIPDPDQEYGKLPAGRLLDEAGVKGLKVGGAAVYEKHANMIVNTGNATSKDIRELADIMKKKVENQFGIVLEEEVIQLGEF